MPRFIRRSRYVSKRPLAPLPRKFARKRKSFKRFRRNRVPSGVIKVQALAAVPVQGQIRANLLAARTMISVAAAVTAAMEDRNVMAAHLRSREFAIDSVSYEYVPLVGPGATVVASQALRIDSQILGAGQGRSVTDMAALPYTKIAPATSRSFAKLKIAGHVRRNALPFWVPSSQVNAAAVPRYLGTDAQVQHSIDGACRDGDGPITLGMYRVRVTFAFKGTVA